MNYFSTLNLFYLLLSNDKVCLNYLPLQNQHQHPAPTEGAAVAPEEPAAVHEVAGDHEGTEKAEGTPKSPQNPFSLQL